MGFILYEATRMAPLDGISSYLRREDPKDGPTGKGRSSETEDPSFIPRGGREDFDSHGLSSDLHIITVA